MKSLKTAISLFLILSSLYPLRGQQTNDKPDLSMINRIKHEEANNSGIEELAFWLTDYAGPRLTGSSGGMRACEIAKQKMEEFGFQNIRIEEAREFNRGGWDNQKTYAAMTAPYYSSLTCNPVAWTGSTDGLIRAEVVLLDIENEDEISKYKGKLGGKIILMPSPVPVRNEINFEPLASRYTDAQLSQLARGTLPAAVRRQNLPSDITSAVARRRLRNSISALLKSEGVAVILNNSGTYNIPASTGAGYNQGEPEPIAELNIPMEAYGRMERLLRHNIPVEMEIDLQNIFFPNPLIYNVIGEIPGTDKQLKDEIVLIGAHLDSWHGGTGAADNASGCIVMMEALRILKNLNVTPRRTIRIALWGGEEQGLNGSAGYVEKYLVDRETGKHKPGFDKFSVYFNMDNGSGRYRGIYLQQNDMVRPVFEQWLKPFEDLGCSTLTIRNTTGTDHLSFDRHGLPAFQFIQDRLEYGRTYHTVMDTYERLSMNDLKINAIITASLVYNAAMRNDKLPRKEPAN
ncbi:MAG: M20/M25/M40 family metallo-hydrolase [Bacteroidetes bacterium]|jgi:hypothetical protein|nr:M20/M25/M40 family metallo-hydrolase [Bacteroidota bacterium]